MQMIGGNADRTVFVYLSNGTFSIKSSTTHIGLFFLNNFLIIFLSQVNAFVLIKFRMKFKPTNFIANGMKSETWYSNIKNVTK